LITKRQAAIFGIRAMAKLVPRKLRQLAEEMVRIAAAADANGRRWQPKEILDDLELGSQTQTIAVTAHIFFEDYIEKCLKGFEKFPLEADFFVTTPFLEIKEKIEASTNFNSMRTKVLLTQNRGRNFGPMFVELIDSLKNYDLMVHVHSKKSNQSHSQEMKGWADKQWDFSLLDGDLVKRTFAHFQSNPKVAIAYPLVTEYMPYWAYSWLANEHFALQWFKGKGTPFVSGQIAYPAGGMFWAKTDVITRMFDSMLTYDSFPEEQGQTDGTIQHTIERLVGVLPLVNKEEHLVYVDYLDAFTTDTGFIWDEFENQSESELFELLKGFESVSFDFFDTLYRRKVHFPDFAKILAGKKLQDLGKLSMPEYFALRNNSEANLRAAVGKAKLQNYGLANDKNIAGRKDIKLSEISIEMSHNSQLEETEALDLEQHFELELAKPRNSMVRLLRNLINSGVRVSIVSDTFYSTTFVRELARKIGIPDVVEIYASSEVGLRKDNGTMWPHFFRVSKAKKRTHIHLGDNRHADQQIPAALGLRNLGVISPGEKFRKHTGLNFAPTLKDFQENFTETVVLGEIVSSFGDSPFDKN
jgi:FMN phosphatase YigB (HAD superfamily)